MSQKSALVIHIEYCTNCQSHNWCTHHSAPKYTQMFVKVSRAIQEQFPNIIVKGNQLPRGLVPIKIAENKYFDAIKNKYVFFPSIGSFEISFAGQVLFSKKLHNTWPIIEDLLEQILFKIDGKSKERPILNQEVTTEEQTITMQNSYLEHAGNRRTFHNEQHQKHDSFTLTDHFKLYTKNISPKNYYAEVEKINSKYNRSSLQIKSAHRIKPTMKENQTCKEFIVDLDSIEEEHIQQELKKLPSRPEIVTMKQWNEDLDSLEKKFEKFQERVVTIQRESKKFQLPSHSEQVNHLTKSRPRESNNSKSPNNSNRAAHQKLQEKILQVNESYKTFLFQKGKYKKLAKIQQYLQGTEKEKNRALKKIYGVKKLDKGTIPTVKKPLLRKNWNKNRHSQESDQFNSNNQHVPVSSDQYSEEDSSEESQEQGNQSPFSESESQQMPKGIPFNSNNNKQIVNSLSKAKSTYLHKKKPLKGLGRKHLEAIQDNQTSGDGVASFNCHKSKNMENGQNFMRRTAVKTVKNRDLPSQSENLGNQNLRKQQSNLNSNTKKHANKEPSYSSNYVKAKNNHFATQKLIQDFKNQKQLQKVQGIQSKKSVQRIPNKKSIKPAHQTTQKVSNNQSNSKTKNFRVKNTQQVTNTLQEANSLNKPERKNYPLRSEENKKSQEEQPESNRLTLRNNLLTPTKTSSKKSQRRQITELLVPQQNQIQSIYKKCSGEEILLEKQPQRLKDSNKSSQSQNRQGSGLACRISKCITQENMKSQELLQGKRIQRNSRSPNKVQNNKRMFATQYNFRKSKLQEKAHQERSKQNRNHQNNDRKLKAKKETNNTKEANNTKETSTKQKPNHINLEITNLKKKQVSQVCQDNNFEQQRSLREQGESNSIHQIEHRVTNIFHTNQNQLEKFITNVINPTNEDPCKIIQEKQLSQRLELKKVSFTGCQQLLMESKHSVKVGKSKKASAKFRQNRSSNKSLQQRAQDKLESDSDQQTQKHQYQSEYLEISREDPLSDYQQPLIRTDRHARLTDRYSKKNVRTSLISKDKQSNEQNNFEESFPKVNSPSTIKRIYAEKGFKTTRSSASILKNISGYLTHRKQTANLNSDGVVNSKKTKEAASQEEQENLSSKAKRLDKSQSFSGKSNFRYSKFKDQTKDKTFRHSQVISQGPKFNAKSKSKKNRKNKNKKNKQNLVLQEKRFNKFQDSEYEFNQILRNKKDVVTDKQSMSRHIKKSNKDSLFNNSNSFPNITDMSRLSIISKGHDLQKQNNPKNTQNKPKKSIRQYSLMPHGDETNNVGTDRAKIRETRERVLMVSVAVQKDEYIERSIQTDNDYLFQIKESDFHQSANSEKVPLQGSLVSHLATKNQMMPKTIEHDRQVLKGEKSKGGCEVERAMLLRQIYGDSVQEQKIRYNDTVKKICQYVIDEPEKQLTKEYHNWSPLSSINSLSSKPIFDRGSIKAQQVIFNKYNLVAFRKIIKMLGERNEFLIIRLFENIHQTSLGLYGVWICDHYHWKCVIVNQMVPVDQSNNPVYSVHKEGQLWPILLEKALALTLGGYSQLMETSTSTLFHMLTGSNSIKFKIRQQYSKNQRFLKFLSQNQKKNFIIHAQKHSKTLEQHQIIERTTNVYYVLSQKIINSTYQHNQDQEVLLKMQEDLKQPFMIKLSKFACQFKSAEILQLRVNHNYTFTTLPDPHNDSNMAVYQILFQDSSFGCITLSSTKPSNLKTYLYKEEDSNILRLVGEAKEKNKTQLFFDCCFQQAKYYIFAECDQIGSILSYFGEGKPKLLLRERIQENGLKNNYTQYVPIDKAPQKQRRQGMPKFMSLNGEPLKGSRSFGSQGMGSRISRKDNKGLDDLKEHFMDYLLGARQ